MRPRGDGRGNPWRAVRTNGSAMALARGDATEVRIVSIPKEVSMASKPAVNLNRSKVSCP